MKKFELTEDDINKLLDERVAFNPDNLDYVRIHNEIRKNLVRELDLFNTMLDRKYNIPRMPGKSKQQVTAWNATIFKQDKTYTALEKWYKTSGDLLATDKKTSLSQITRDTKLHINTVRKFLELHQDKLSMPKISISECVMDILSRVFNGENMV